ncbi:SDR family NAD(P)-dependent oxidoreductase [Streptomyces armeniacus]|uniref:SDR family NAD(P)-dependent oxidoreductase n=1 Tax=Streptomyces armeniacus TaxID=83291 RepID=A0A345XIN7_9ACTN|nr:SDR family oxidoreductase [Streptomyces armeniacus]AXK31503.1 SDR family NAD(P)-dependent oxidoreductase [Streptomyces armeniacus]
MSAATAPATGHVTRTLTGKTALVTGGGRGIGRGIAERLGRDGARVAVHYGSDETSAKEAAAAIEAAGGEAFTVGAKLGRPGDAEALWAAFDEHADGLDILVNNAGITGAREPISGLTPDDFDVVFDVNAKAPFFVTRLGLPRLRDGGRIISVSTVLTRGVGMPELIAYSMSKGAMDVFTLTLAKELGPRGITVNTVAPGIVDTDMNAGWLRTSEEAWSGASGAAALGRVGRPEDIADVAAFLASEDGRWVTGQWIDASGGSLL